MKYTPSWKTTRGSWTPSPSSWELARRITDVLLSMGLKQRSQSVSSTAPWGLHEDHEMTERCCFSTLPASQRAKSPSVPFGSKMSAGL